MRKTSWGAWRLTLLGSSLVLPVAAAEPSTFRLSWVRGPGTEDCPNAQQLSAAVSARLGRDPFSNTAERDLEGVVTRRADDWQAQLRVVGANQESLGSRELQAHGTDCSSLADAVTLAVVLTIDPDAKLDGAPTKAAEPPPSTPEASPAPASSAPNAAPPLLVAVPAPPVARAEAAKSTAPTDIAARALLASGVLPKASFGAERAGELPLAAELRLSLSLSYLPEVRTADRRFGFGLTAGGLGLCYVALASSRLTATACAEAQGGAIHAVVYELSPTAPGQRPWLSLRFGPRLAFPVAGPVAVELGALAVAPLIRQEFAVAGASQPIFQTAPVSLLASLGLKMSIH